MIKLLSIFATLSLAISAHAASFQATNSILPNATIVSYPTNSPGALTGVPIDVRSFSTGDFYFTARPNPNCSNATFIVTLLASHAVQAPVIFTNGPGAITNSDWPDASSAGNEKLVISIPHFSTTDASNYVNWSTNISWFIQNATFVGCLSVTNNSTNSGTLNTLTNCDFGIIGKAVASPASAQIY